MCERAQSHLVTVLALARAKDAVVEGVQGVAEVRLLEAVAVQDLQSVQDASNREP